jgi:hypothetical protein
MITISNILLATFLFIIVILIIVINNRNKKVKLYKDLKENELENIFKERWNKEEQDFKLKKTELQIEEKEIQSDIAQLKTSLKEKEKRYEEVNQDLDLYRKGKLKEIDSAGAEYEQRKQLLIDQSINKYRTIQLEYANNKMAVTKEEIEKAEEELKKIFQTLEVERSKRDAINKEILRQRKIAEEQDFYKIHFTEADKKDIEILRPMAPRLQHPEVINKIIWNSYYQKPLAELRKRLLPNGDISGIYKITRIKTNEIYIGQTTSIDRRFQDHVKTALGVGTLASSQFHRVMSEDGPENFYFEILEEVKKDKLRERESYYISWFKSDKFGLNSISGDKNK